MVTRDGWSHAGEHITYGGQQGQPMAESLRGCYQYVPPYSLLQMILREPR